MAEEEKIGCNDDVPLPKPFKGPKGKIIRGGRKIRQDHNQSGEAPDTNVEPLRSHNQSSGVPDADIVPLRSSLDLNEFKRQPQTIRGRRASRGAKLNSTESPLNRGYFFPPPNQFPVDPNQQGINTMHPDLLTGSSSIASLPQPAPVLPHSDDTHGAKRSLPPHLTDEHDKPAQKRRFCSPIVDNPNQPPLLGVNPYAHPIGGGLQPASTAIGGRVHAPSNEPILCPYVLHMVLFGQMDSTSASIPGQVSLGNQRETSNPVDVSFTLNPPENPEGVELTFGPPGNEQSESRQPLDPDPDPDIDTNLKL